MPLKTTNNLRTFPCQTTSTSLRCRKQRTPLLTKSLSRFSANQSFPQNVQVQMARLPDNKATLGIN